MAEFEQKENLFVLY